MATTSPTGYASAPTGGLPATARSQSSTQVSRAARRRFLPPSCVVRASTSGLVSRKFDGDMTSSICRAQNATTSSWCRFTPSTPVVALCHHC